MPSINVTTIYGHNTKRPLVVVRFPKKSLERGEIQLSVEEARDLALNLLQGAESAIQDAFIVEYFKELGIEERQVGALLAAFRDRRHDRQNDMSG